MAWTSADQNPSLAPAPGLSSPSYAAALQQAAMYGAPGGGSSSTGMAPAAQAASGGSYAERLNATAAEGQQASSRSTGNALEKSAQRKVPANMSAYTDAYSTNGRSLPPNQGVAVQAEAARLGIDPSDLAAVIGYETIGTFDPAIKGGKKGRYFGLIQMGPTERKAYGWRDGMSFEEQLHGPVHNYLVDRGVRPGHGIAEIYSIINAGSLKNGRPRWNASDRPGHNVRTHTAAITRSYDPRYAYLDPGASTEQPVMFADAGSDMLAGGNVPMPRLRPERTEMAYAPAPETMNQAPFDAVLGASRDRRPQPPTPQANPRRDRLQAAAPAPAGGGYVVRRGDNLSKIAQRELGDANRWREIAAANNLRNPNRLQPGQRLVIPGGRAQASVAAPPVAETNVPTPRMRPERGVGVPTPRLRPSRGTGMEGSPEARSSLREDGMALHPDEVARQRRLIETGGRTDAPNQVISGDVVRQFIRQKLDVDENGNRVQPPPAPRSPPRATRETWNSMGLGSRGNEYTQLSIDRPPQRRPAAAPPPPGPYDDQSRQYDTPGPITQANERMGVFEGTPAPENWRPRPDFSAADPSTRVPPTWSPVTEFPPAPVPAGPGMDTSGLIRPPSADERALQTGARPRLPTGAQPMDPRNAAQMDRADGVFRPLAVPGGPPWVASNGIRFYAVR